MDKNTAVTVPASSRDVLPDDMDDGKQTVVEGSRAPSLEGKDESKPRAVWKAEEEHLLPHNNMILVFSALMLTLSLVSSPPLK